MLETIVVAAALFVCRGEVYTDTPKAGCQPLQESNKEGFSTIQEAPEFNSKSSTLATGDAERPAKGIQPHLPAASDQEFAMYEEWVKLSTKSSSIGARDLSPGEFERWTNLKQVFGNSPLSSPGSAIFHPHQTEPVFIHLPRENISTSFQFDPGCQPSRSGC
jgi:hypothetical protein